MIKKFFSIVTILVFLQFLRIIFKSLIFGVLDRTILMDVIISSIYMLIFIGLFVAIIKRRKIELQIFPVNFSAKYEIFTVAVLAFIIVTPVITRNYSLTNIISLLYGAVITVVFEEILFRGFVYAAIKQKKNDLTAFMLSTILFGIWHLGYIDTIIWRTSLFFPNSDISQIMFWKVVTGLSIGALLGFCRYKSKNVYMAILVHTLINTFGN